MLVKRVILHFEKSIYLIISFLIISSWNPVEPHACGNLSFYLPKHRLLGPNRAIPQHKSQLLAHVNTANKPSGSKTV
jgi:hypothetical protein